MPLLSLNCRILVVIKLTITTISEIAHLTMDSRDVINDQHYYSLSVLHALNNHNDVVDQRSPFHRPLCIGSYKCGWHQFTNQSDV